MLAHDRRRDVSPYKTPRDASRQAQRRGGFCKSLVYQRLPHDWLIHHDADEILEHRDPGKTLRDAVEEAEHGGYNALNFEEFVFLPQPADDFYKRDYRALSLRYYLFQPRKNRLNRAWRRTAGFDQRLSGGHRLHGVEPRFHPQDHVLRHYIVLNQEHALRKYLQARHDPRDLRSGWHYNRTRFTAANLRLPPAGECLFRLPGPESRAFRRDRPADRHFWQWPGDAPAAASAGLWKFGNVRRQTREEQP